MSETRKPISGPKTTVFIATIIIVGIKKRYTCTNEIPMPISGTSNGY